MNKTEAVKILKGIAEEAGAYSSAVSYVASDEDVEALNMAIEALEQDKKEIINMKSVFNLSDDLISRQAAIYALRAMQTYKLGAGEDMLLIDQAEAQTELMLLPSAQPFTDEQIQTMQELEAAQVEKAYELGKADRPTGHWIENDNGTFSCSNCQSWIPEEQHYYARYCLYCGARMESDTE